MPALKRVTIHTDGGCEGNPGPGGWGAVLECAAHRKEISGGDPATTNNRMELQAAISALSCLKVRCEVELFTDSSYVRDGITKWITGWEARGWVTKVKTPVKNDDLWRELATLTAGHQITWRWLKGHAGHALNERCDQLAQEQIAKIRATFSAAQLGHLLAEFERRRAPAAVQAGFFDPAEGS